MGELMSPPSPVRYPTPKVTLTFSSPLVTLAKGNMVGSPDPKDNWNMPPMDAWVLSFKRKLCLALIPAPSQVADKPRMALSLTPYDRFPPVIAEKVP